MCRKRADLFRLPTQVARLIQLWQNSSDGSEAVADQNEAPHNMFSHF